MAESISEKRESPRGVKIGLWVGGIILVIILVIAGLWIWGAGDAKKAQEPGNPYPEEVRGAYLSSCNKDAGEGHEAFCLCSLEYFEGNYSLEQFKDLGEKHSQTDEAPSQVFVDATDACSDKIPQ